MNHKDLLIKMNKIELKVIEQEISIKQIFAFLDHFIKEQNAPRKKIGFRTGK